jgi:hypothetical protein
MKSDHQQHKWSCRLVAATAALVCGVSPTHAESGPFTPYKARTEFLPTSPGSARAGLYGYLNPAMLNYVDELETVFTWSNDGVTSDLTNDWGLYSGLPHLGFGVADRTVVGGGYREYRLAIAGGDRTHGVGLAYGWANGDGPRPPDVVTLGTLIRPSPSLSIGVALTSALSTTALESAADLSMRPFANDRLTLFGTAAVSNDRAGDEHFWNAGASLTLMPGLHISARYGDDRTVTAGIHANFGSVDVWTQTLRERDPSSHAHIVDVPHQHADARRQTAAPIC